MHTVTKTDVHHTVLDRNVCTTGKQMYTSRQTSKLQRQAAVNIHSGRETCAHSR